MKKSLLGYNSQEVDETIEYLETANAKLEKQVKQLRAELEELRQKQSEALPAEDPAKEKAAKELEARCGALTSENEKLRAEVAALTAQVQQAAGEQDALEQVSEICRTAYLDMSEAKRKTKERIESFTGGFLDKWTAYYEKVVTLSEELRKTQAESRDAFLSAADEILSKYAVIAQEGESLHGYMDELKLTEGDMRGQVRSILDSLGAEEEIAGAAAEPEEPAKREEEPKYAVLRALRERETLHRAPGLSAVPTLQNDKKTDNKVAPLPSRETASRPSQSEDIGISVGVNARNIVND